MFRIWKFNNHQLGLKTSFMNCVRAITNLRSRMYELIVIKSTKLLTRCLNNNDIYLYCFKKYKIVTYYNLRLFMNVLWFIPKPILLRNRPNPCCWHNPTYPIYTMWHYYIITISPYPPPPVAVCSPPIQDRFL